MENSIATINQGRPVYFSYARNSKRKPEWEHISDSVDVLLNTLTANGLEYRVDVKDIGMGDKISKFEEEIGWNSEVVVIIFSDKYFRSLHCMYEFVQIKNALQQYPEKRLMCIKSGDFNLSDFNYVMELEQYWNNQKIEYEKIEYHRLREHSGTEIAAYENGFYLDDIRKLYSFFSAINYSNAANINYEGFVGDIVRYYKTTPKPKLTPKPPKNPPQPPPYTAQSQPNTAQAPTHIAQPQPTPKVAQNEQSTAGTLPPATKKSPKVPILIAAIVLGIVIFCWARMGDSSVVKLKDIPQDPYVDLGLPSGTLWATHNVGANSPEEYGDYFAWGETETKSNYDWSTYKYAEGAENKITKYCGDEKYGNNGFTDTHTTLELSDDAATVNWGRDWCMPTYEQFLELCNYCTHERVTVNNISGYLFTSDRNGERLFLPAMGFRNGTRIDGTGSIGYHGYYWSSSLCSGNSAFALFFYNSEPDAQGCQNRNYGQLVRAVRRKK